MAGKSSSAASLPWIWVVEFLSTCKEVDTSLLNELIARTPDILDPLAKDARERVTLRCLEDLCGFNTLLDVCSVLDSKFEFDLSKTCEDVILHIEREMPMQNVRTADLKSLKWNLYPFIMHKRATLPKCALQQLKDTIAEGSQSFPASLKERSQPFCGDNGVSNGTVGILDLAGTNTEQVVDKGTLISPNPEIVNEILPDDAPNRIFLPTKRDRRELDGKNPTGHDHENQTGTVNGGDLHPNSKKLKENISHTSHSLGVFEVPPHEDALLEESSERTRQCSGEGFGTTKGFQEESFEERRPSGKIHDKCAASTKVCMSNELYDCENHHNQLAVMCISDKEHEARPGDGHLKVNSVDEAKDGSEHPDRTLQNITGDEGRDNSEHGFQVIILDDATSNGSFRNSGADELKNNMDQYIVPDTSSDSDGYRNEEIDIVRKKQSFFSQFTSSSNFWETADFTELNLCMKCNKRGQLLVCSSSSCPMVVHENCLGSSASFDDLGNFYCPFCAYSHAISEYLQVKKKTSSARKELAAFMGVGIKRHSKKPSKISRRKERGQFQKNGYVEESNLANVGGCRNDPQCTSTEDGRRAYGHAENGNLINGGDHARPFDLQDGSTADEVQADVQMKESSLANDGQPVCTDDPQCGSAEVGRKAGRHGEESNLINDGDRARPFDPQAESMAEKRLAEEQIKESSLANDGLCVHTDDPWWESPEVGQKEDGHGKENNLINVGDLARTSDPQPGSTEDDGGMKESSLANGGDHVNKLIPHHESIEDIREAQGTAPCVDKRLHCTEEEITVISETVCGINEGEEGGINLCQEPESRKVVEKQHDQVRADPKSKVDSQRRTEPGIQKEGLQQRVRVPSRGHPSTPKIIHCRETSEEENDKSTASPYSMRIRRKERHYTYPAIPLLRRKKLVWSAAEEKMLKEGVQKFASAADKNIPWTKILESGESVFLKGRTTIDLKDKWRNICKRSSGSK